MFSSSGLFAAKGFRGGTHPPGNKGLSDRIPIQEMPLPKRVVIPFSQHIGAPARPVVAVGDRVKTGQVIGEPAGFISAFIHASIAGRVIEIAARPHPSERDVLSCIIESDGTDEWIPLTPAPSLRSRDEIASMVRQAGIVGMGGATFPTHVKISPPEGKRIEILILNGAECEPYLTSDHRLMVERAQDVLRGGKLLAQALHVTRGVIAIEANKPDAATAMAQVASSDPVFVVMSLPAKYPQGAEKQLIKTLTGREVPSGGLPMDVGVLVQNVGTAWAVHQAATSGKPLVQRVVSVTGEGVRNPANLLVRIGTPIRDLIDFCGGFNGKPGKIIFGGPMMGAAQSGTEVPVTKGTSGIVVLPEDILSCVNEVRCIRCGRCVTSCPAGLLPCALGDASGAGRMDLAEQAGVLDCIECGCCAYVCPSKRPLVHHIKVAKAEIHAARKKKG